MPKKFFNQKGAGSILVVLLLVFGIALSTYLASNKQVFKPQASTVVALNTPVSAKVLLLIYDPVIESEGGQKLTQLKNWNDPSAISQTLVSDFSQISNYFVNYSIVETVNLDQIPNKKDGFSYTDTTYLNCLNNTSTCHSPDLADYLAMINVVDACGKRNRGEIDELWIWGGPYFGFWESNLAGPNAFFYNSSPTTGSTCQKLLPIMGFNYERGQAEAIHDFGHRMESTMTQLYGSWHQNRTSTSFDKFGLVKAQSPGYDYSGCGSIHFPPNSSSANNPYDYSSTVSVNSICDDFANYPNLSDPQTSAIPVNCQAWGCDQLGFIKWWFSHLPRADGTGPDGKLNNWWQYFIDPQKVLPAAGTFSGLTATFNQNQATFNFNYSGTSNNFKVDLSTSPTLSTDVYLDFGTGFTSPVTVTNPTKWDKYSCGRTLYYKIFNSDKSISSQIGQATVNCPSSSPSPSQSPSPSPSPSNGLNPPTNLTATPQQRSKIQLKWVDTNTIEKGYLIERSLNPTSGFTQINKTGSNKTSYTAGGLTKNTTYYFRIRALGVNNTYSSYSSIVSATTLP